MVCRCGKAEEIPQKVNHKGVVMEDEPGFDFGNGAGCGLFDLREAGKRVAGADGGRKSGSSLFGVGGGLRPANAGHIWRRA